MEEMDGSVYSAIWVGLGGKEILNFVGKWDVWKTEGMIMNGERDGEVSGEECLWGCVKESGEKK